MVDAMNGAVDILQLTKGQCRYTGVDGEKEGLHCPGWLIVA